MLLCSTLLSCVSAVTHSCSSFLQYIPSVEDTVLGIVVDTKPDVSIHLHSEVCELILVSRYLNLRPPWIMAVKITIMFYSSTYL